MNRALRTQEEILLRISSLTIENDWIGTQKNDLICYLDFEHAKDFLKPEVTPEKWKEIQMPLDREKIITQIKDYMEFAWEKANNCRGISAMRSIYHYMTWTWLLCDDFGNLSDYEYYGKDDLVKICEYYGIDHTQYDDGVRANSEIE